MDTTTVTTWVTEHGPGLVIGAIILFVLFRLAKPAIHRLVIGVLRAQQASLPAGSAPAEEVAKRAATLEDLLAKVVRGLFLFALAALVLTAFDLWGILAGLGLLAAALTLAGQDIVLDYLMGILILVEGQYYKGDWIAVKGPLGAVEGTVEEVGLRRTVLRDASGTVHSISNGLIRLSSNLTRVYSVASAEVQILHPAELDRAIAIANQVAADLERDPDWAGALYEAPVETAVTALSADGATLKVQRRVPPEARMKVSSELRRRMAVALGEASIGTRRWDPSDSPETAATAPATSGDGDGTGSAG